MAVLLVCTVGGAPEPVIRSILTQPHPDKVVFICSSDTCSSVNEKILPALEAAGLRLGPAQREIFQVSDPQALDACVREIAREVSSQVRRWRDQHGDKVIVDPTGGTKVMSIALAFVARRWHCTFRYIGGTQREQRPSGPGAVLAGAEQVVHTLNPLDVLGYQLAEDALTLANAGNYAAARQLLEQGVRSAADPSVKRSLNTLTQLLGVFALWDQFDHAGAAARLQDLEKNRNDLACLLDDASFRAVENVLPAWKDRLAVLAAGRPSRELIEDLLANAERRLREGRYDDAVARLYRAVEAMAQWRLARQYGIPDTGAVPAEKIPEPLRAELAPAPDGAFEIGLQNAYRLLDAFGDPLGSRFRELNLHHPQQSPLAERNHSILAHGWKPVSQKGSEALRQRVFALASELGLSEQTLMRFPELKPRLA
ncbi:MAG TPA: TIGR02710 family CRISPR-associated CARF protein [Bryobacteraceae bacterium]|nr:TIGR02710 family CRISPR-associated CARF protein [Bryobacteraceae bacterium]